MIAILAIILTSFLNRVRGGLFPNLPAGRIIASLGVGIVFGFLTINPLIAVAVAAGYYAWAVLGWGLYFAAATGQWRKDEVEVAFIDRIGLWLVPFITPTTNWSNYRRGVICMGLRGGIFALPLFAVLYSLGYHAAAFAAPVFFLQGVNYFIAGRIISTGNPIGLAEWMWGAVIGATLAVTLNLI